jgi:transposase
LRRDIWGLLFTHYARHHTKILTVPPKYAPDLNPIEKFFAKLKHHLRKAQKRSFEGICEAIAQSLETVTHQECTTYFISADYEPA